MKVSKPKFISSNVPYFDLDQIDDWLDSVELSDEFFIRPDTVYVGNLPHAVTLAGKTYYTAMIGINGRCVLTADKASDLIREYSKRSVTSPRFWLWAACKLKIRPLYFAGENSFIPEKSPLWLQTSWIGSRWCDSIYTEDKTTFVTFTQPQTQRQVVVHVNMRKSQLVKQLACVRVLIISSQQLIERYFKQMLPSSSVQLRIPVNLPERSDLGMPPVTAVQIRDFIYTNHGDDICAIATDECCNTIREATELADYDLFRPRELTQARRQPPTK
ncbi:hypothetical protein [Loigolactobacillus zhaoyuanensis]|uniref:Uncharacterized protein n=1 Tax=Loigolactobacillus zhaoyuanensis TaxID=2486017 RepID=A0ABW8UC43_9LACO